MNDYAPATDDCRLPAAIALLAHLRRAVWCAGALLACALCGFAQSPADTSGLERLVAGDAVRLLASEDPEIRGEAAIIVASACIDKGTGFDKHEPKLLELARDKEPAARHRATIALGLLGTPQAISYLEEQLRTVEGRTGDDGIAAAFALGLVAPDRVHTTIARTLRLFTRGSWKRQHNVLLGLLVAMSQTPERAEQHALRDLFDDDANRAPGARALLLQLLLPIDGSLDREQLMRLLRRGSDEEQQAVLRWLAEQPPLTLRPWRDELSRIARRADLAPHRATALLALTRMRDLPALEIAARALRSSSPVECGQGMQSMLAIGGARTIGILEQHLLDERDATRKAAMLRNFQAPPSKRLVDHAVSIATAADQPLDTRVAAAELLARSRPQRAVPVLRDLFRSAQQPDALITLAKALQRVESQPTELRRLLNLPVLLSQHPDHWRALLSAGHAAAQRQVLGVLQNPRARDHEVRTALRCWRSARILRITGEGGAPALLADLLD